MPLMSSAPSWLTGSSKVRRTDGQATPSTASGTPMLTNARKAIGSRSLWVGRGCGRGTAGTAAAVLTAGMMRTRVRRDNADGDAASPCDMSPTSLRRLRSRRRRRRRVPHRQPHVLLEHLVVQVLLHDLAVCADE